MAQFYKNNNLESTFKNITMLKNYIDSNETLNSEINAVDQKDPLDDSQFKKFWMNILKPKKSVITFKTREKVKNYEYFINLISLICVILSQCDYELEYFPFYYSKDKQKEYNGNKYRIANLGLSVVLIYCNYWSIYYEYLLRVECKLMINVGFTKSYYFIKFIIHLICEILQPLPYIEYSFSVTFLEKEIKFELQTFFYALIYIKFHHLLKLMVVRSTVYEFKNIEYSDYDVEYILYFKRKFKEAPFKLLFLSFSFIVVIFGFMARMFERYLY